MKLALHARSLVLALVVSAAASPALAQSPSPFASPASSGPLAPAELELAGIGGFGRGTLVMPGVFEGRLRSLLVDDEANPRLELDATLVEHLFILPHAPAGSLSGVVRVAVDPEADEGEIVAVVHGEWSVDASGEGRIAAELRVPGADATIAPIGAIAGSFRVAVPPTTPQIAPPLTLPPAGFGEPLAAASVAHHGVAVRPASFRVGSRGHVPASALEERPSGPTIIVDWIPSPEVARVALRWSLEG